MNIYKIKNRKWEVPDFVHKEFHPKRSKYCVCIPVINEGERIQKQLRKMKPIAKDIDIIIADGGSKDGSLNFKFLKQCGIKALLVKKGPGKLSAQIRMALAYAVQEGYSGYIFMDGNNKDDPFAIYKFIPMFEKGFDHIQGSRFIKGGKAINTPFVRYWGIKLVHAPMVSIAAGYRYTDTTNGFRAYSKKLILDSRIKPFRNVLSEYEIHYYLAVRAARLKFKIAEVPVTRGYPKSGEIPTKLSPFLGYVKLLKSTAKACLGYYNPK